MNGRERESTMYGGYLKSIQQYYDREPLVRATLQLVLSIFTVAFFSFLAIRPTLTTITTLVKKIEEQKEADQRLSRKIVQLAEAQDFLSAQGEEISRLMRTAVPTDPEVKRLAQEIEFTANQNSVLLTSLSFQASPLSGREATPSARTTISAGKNEQFVIFAFTAGGTQGALFDFLDGLERLDRAVTLTNLTFSKPQTTGSANLPLVVAGRATAYYLPTRASR